MGILDTAGSANRVTETNKKFCSFAWFCAYLIKKKKKKPQH